MPTKAEQIRTLNDALRQTFQGGRVLQTQLVSALSSADQVALRRLVQTFSQFDGDNDPHGEHDLGTIDHAGERYMWKIDYYDTALEFGSPDASDPAVTTRVLTLMHADEA